MAITAADVNKLRQETGAGMMDCKKALTEADGDFEKAKEILRKQGQKIADKRADNATAEGIVLAHVSPDGTTGKVIALACETEPVSKVADFQNLAMAIMSTAVASDVTDKATLLATPQADGRALQDHITDLMGKIGEKIDVASFETVSADKVVSYIHSNGKLGVLVGLNNTNGTDVTEVGKDIAMQIAAMKPVALDKDGVDATIVQREIEIGKEQARQEGKPEAMLEKIAMGKLNKFYKDNTLLNQEFVKDTSLTISQLLEKTSKGLTVSAFKRVAIG
ncbi:MULTISPECIES: translation elongation factor Ts [Spirosoma]|uniref:Elongation factor Ts n=1 Tax=Spirosoma linguale (strain ATCC 33905 / DSM 74 / LMG 10896 / Claus 1) TaxID=504472 RepID=D2QPR3_SPILD|nr:translation elongation factor Ts [Spirosoma sp.]ADB40722.1 translation elongation factor Ts [Spirosoma linguale DSM 74]MCX6214188.1 translation elongation factor Ts [Spirosoma sp.]